MASSYSTDLKLELMVTGENAGTWGDKTNTNLNLVQQAIAGFEQVTLSSGGTVALVMSDGALSNARNLVIKFATATIAASTVCTIPNGIEKFYIFDCTGLTNPTNLTIKTASGTGFTPDAAKIYAAYADGTNLKEVSLDTLGGTVAAAQIADSAVTTAKIAADAVTAAKIADNAVVTAAINADAVTSAKIADDAVGVDQLANTAVTAATYTVATITVDAQGRITNASSGSAGEADELFFIEGSGQTGVIQNPETKMKAGSEVMVYAQGGAGGGGGNLGENGGPFGGAQGAPGGMVFFVTTLSTALASSPYTLGAAGAGGPSGPNPGVAGGDTIVTNFVTAPGGTGGDAGNRGPSSGGNPSNRGIGIPPVNNSATVSYSPKAPTNAYGPNSDGTLNNTFTNPKAMSGHIMRNVFSAPGTFATFGNNTGGAGANTNQNSGGVPGSVPPSAGFAATGNAFIGIMVKN